MLDIEFEIRITFEIVEEEDNFEEEVDKNDSVGCDEDFEASLVEVSAEGKVDDGVDFDDDDVDNEDDVDVDVDDDDEVDDDVDDDVDEADLRFV